MNREVRYRIKLVLEQPHIYTAALREVAERCRSYQERRRAAVEWIQANRLVYRLWRESKRQAKPYRIKVSRQKHAAMVKAPVLAEYGLATWDALNLHVKNLSFNSSALRHEERYFDAHWRLEHANSDELRALCALVSGDMNVGVDWLSGISQKTGMRIVTELLARTKEYANVNDL